MLFFKIVVHKKTHICLYIFAPKCGILLVNIHVLIFYNDGAIALK